MFPSHNPYPQLFSWLCATNGIPEDKIALAARDMQHFVRQARGMFHMPLGKRMPYDEGRFRGAYLLAYFPYYIEPLYYTMELAKLQFAERPEGTMKAAFLGGGPAPEVLGLAAYLRDHARHITGIRATVFDREPGWGKVQQELLPLLAPGYSSHPERLTLAHQPCDVAACTTCGSPCDAILSDTDFIVSQNFMTEIYADRERAFATFRNIIAKSRCKAIVFIENAYHDIFKFMAELAARLHAEGLTVKRGEPVATVIRPRFPLPETIRTNLFTGEEWLIPKTSVKFHRMCLFIKR
ncbi:hypothetical protein LPW11_09930 [Geomonas sp. RF6]|uniref:hypothetical protein n=1 Tax=Geomonas sp. RF6 TaxID=2897342 RepID=UPI001E40E9DA|nr:hypothetical protein [Geomonas sp. RF6]UFS72493.1 hypothetical protein LPW11_09930 [Geomonas sp. RF6]